MNQSLLMRSRLSVGVAVALPVVTLLFASSAAAVSIADLQAQIAVLLQRLTQLQGQTQSSGVVNDASGSAAVSASICIANPSRMLAYGDSGDDVRALQEFLRDQGYFAATAKPTGFFGSMTRRALASWQQNQGLAPAGILGPLSRSRIKNWCGGNAGDPSTDPQCKSWFDGCNTCSRQTPGGPAMCTLRACVLTPGTTQPAPYCTARFDGSATNKPPVISGLIGPTTLPVDQQGTWTVTASDPENGVLSYSVSWGDTAAPLASSGLGLSAFMQGQQASFTHSYASAGQYTVTVTVRDSSGLSATATVTVQVGSNAVACTQEYVPVCGRPQGCANTCPAGFACPMYCQMYPAQTYGNSCSLNAAGAQLIHTGACLPSETPAQLGEACGGNMVNARACASGLRCVNTASHLPVGDVGGTCVVQ